MMTAHHLYDLTGQALGVVWRLIMVSAAVFTVVCVGALIGLGVWTIVQIASVP